VTGEPPQGWSRESHPIYEPEKPAQARYPAGKPMAVHIRAEWSSPALRSGNYARVTVHPAVVEQSVRAAPSQYPRDRS